MTPHKALYGSNPQLLPTYNSGAATVEDVDLTLTDGQQIQQQLQQYLIQAQARMKKYADAKRVDKSYEIRQWVWAKLHKYKLQLAA